MTANSNKDALAARVLEQNLEFPLVLIVPRLLRIPAAAKYLSATTWQIETLLRENVIPSFILGKRRVVDRLELDRYVKSRNAEAKTELLKKAG
jgi:hypothetical protein